MRVDPLKLTGDELVSYLEDHREEFNGNGDAICMAAGYSIEAEDGSRKCNFTAFVEAVSNSNAVKNQQNS